MFCRLLAFGVGVTLVSVCNADILFDNFGLGDSFQYHSGLTISDDHMVAVPFIVPGTYKLVEVTVGLAFSPGTVYRVALTQGGAATPGPDIYFWPFVGIDGAVHLGPTGPVNMPPGDYYIVVQKQSGDDGSWGFNGIGQTGTYAHTNLTTHEWEYSDGLMPALRVEAVPEPASLLALGGLTLTLLRRKRKA